MFSPKVGLELAKKVGSVNFLKLCGAVQNGYSQSKFLLTHQSVFLTECKCNISQYIVSEKKKVLQNSPYVAKKYQEQLMLNIIKNDQPLTKSEVDEIKSEILTQGKCVNKDNFDGMFLSICATEGAFTVGRSYFLNLVESENSFNLASVGKFFQLCFKCKDMCTQEDKELIIDVYKKIISRHDVLDSNTCESILLGLSITEAWKESSALIEMCKLTSEPSSKMFSAFISAAFKNGDNKLGWMLMEDALQNGKTIFSEAISQCLINGDIKVMNFLLELLEKYADRISSELANELIDHYQQLIQNGYARITSISKR